MFWGVKAQQWLKRRQASNAAAGSALAPVTKTAATFPRFEALPYELRELVLYFAVDSRADFFLDCEAVTLGFSLQARSPNDLRIVWRNSTGAYVNLLCVSKQFRIETARMLFARFAFYCSGWGYVMKFADKFKVPFRIHNRIRHLVYAPNKARWQSEHRHAVDLVLSGMPMLSSVRLMVTPAVVEKLSYLGSTVTGTEYIVNVAEMFSRVGKVAVVGQSLTDSVEFNMVEDARARLKDERWYWDLKSNYHVGLHSSDEVEL